MEDSTPEPELGGLTDELWLTILGFVPPLYLLQSVARTNRRFARLIQGDESDDEEGAFWSNHPLVVSLQQQNASATRLTTKHQIQRCCIAVDALRKQHNDDDDATSTPFPACLNFGSLLVSKEEADHISQVHPGRRVCVASTTHNGRSEDLTNVLSNRHDGRQAWWSSKPDPNPSNNADEVLLFATRHGQTLLSEVCIEPLRDPFHRRFVYSWQKTVIRAYQLPLECLSTESSTTTSIRSGSDPCSFQTVAQQQEEEENQEIADLAVPLGLRMPEPQANGPGLFRPRLIDLRQRALMRVQGQVSRTDRATIEHLLQGHEPVYESPEYPVIDPNSSELLRFFFPPAGVVVANVVTFTLIGKNNEQHQGTGYYACVERVNCLGIPLYTQPE